MAPVHPITPATRNCRQESSTPSTFSAKWSITRICTVKIRAQINTSRSPLESFSVSVIQSRYMPTAARAAPIHTFPLALFPRKILAIGTRIIYSVVINPAFPTVVYMIPNCWNSAALPRAIPQRIPPLSVTPKGAPSFPSFMAFCLLVATSGSNTRAPRINLAPLKLKGPM